MNPATATPYPSSVAERDRWILERRTARRVVNPWEPHGAFVELERAESGDVVPVTTLLLASRECPWRCLMCDLWKTTLSDPTPAGAIPAQIRAGLRRLREQSSADGHRTAGPSRQIKLYNGGSFFDAGAVPPEDYGPVVALVDEFERVIVECHPALVGRRTWQFQELLQAGGGERDGSPRLEVAMGLETVHPTVLERLNKRMSLDDFGRASAQLREHGIALRVFVLVRPPFLSEGESLEWAKRSVDFAFECSASVVSLIPVRATNGALESLAARGEFEPPRLETLESAMDYGVGLGRGRVFADLWDLERFSRCRDCLNPRRERLDRMNRTQSVLPAVKCEACGRGG